MKNRIRIASSIVAAVSLIALAAPAAEAAHRPYKNHGRAVIPGSFVWPVAPPVKAGDGFPGPVAPCWQEPCPPK